MPYDYSSYYPPEIISRQIGLKVPIPKVAGVVTSAVGVGLLAWVRWDDKAKGTF